MCVCVCLSMCYVCVSCLRVWRVEIRACGLTRGYPVCLEEEESAPLGKMRLCEERAREEVCLREGGYNPLRRLSAAKSV